jgi:DNA-binding beta-propeller fold protein YncE
VDVYQPVGIGSDFLGYRIEELIGRGGMGVVYRAYDLRLKRPVALKLVAPSLARDEQFRERFARESELVMSLEHPNVVPIYDAGDVDGRVYLAMRLVDGTDLRTLLRAEGALAPDRAIVICRQIAAALDAAHSRGLVHRDVKPSNVLLDSSGHVYLADFGLTRTLDDEGSGTGDDRAVGTPAYLAPEQLEGRPADGRADVYSLGCVLYECLTGEAVFPRDSRLAVAWAHLEEEPPRASKRRVGLPEAVDAVVGRALAKEPEQRFATCGALVAAAREALGLGTVGSSRRRRSLLLAGAIVLAAAVVGGVIATTLAVRGGKGALYAKPNTLAEIDPTTDRVSKVFPVGADPVAAAGASRTVWVYSRGAGAITQFDGFSNTRIATIRVSPPAECCSLFTGPVLAANRSGDTAWFVEGGTTGRRALLVRLFADSRTAHKFPLPITFTPTGVAAENDTTAWVVGHDSRGDEVLRIDAGSGRVTAATGVPRSARVDSIAFGYGKAWVLSSAMATLYAIDPRSTPKVVKTLHIGPGRAMRPEIMAPNSTDIWIRVTGNNGVQYSIDPHKMTSGPGGPPGANGSPWWEENEGVFSTLWWYHQPWGIVGRQYKDKGPIRYIWVARHRPRHGGPCITSMAATGGSMWVTLAPVSSDRICKRS